MGTSAYTGSPFWRGVFAGARWGRTVVFAGLACALLPRAGLAILHFGPAEAVLSPLSAALLAQVAIFAALFTASVARYLACAVPVAALPPAGPLYLEASGAARSGFVAASLSELVLLEDRTAAVVRSLFTVAGGPLAGGC